MLYLYLFNFLWGECALPADDGLSTRVRDRSENLPSVVRGVGGGGGSFNLFLSLFMGGGEGMVPIL